MNSSVTGETMFDLVRRLYPICRSITGAGARATLDIIRELVPLKIHEVPSGTAAFDWTIPKEWNVREAWVKGPDGAIVADFRDHNLHLLNYSVPVRKRMPLSELRPHLHSMPEHPDWIPYRTSYYREDWGFCLQHRRLAALPEGEYEVCVDTTLEAGSLSYGELYLPGTGGDEILFSTHICHPSMANDNLSGIAVAAFLGRTLADSERRHSVRILFIPGTIGSLAWLSRNEDKLARIRHGLVLTGLGDAGGFTYKRSRRGDAFIDRAAAHVLKTSGLPHLVRDFHPYGYDERQFCSPAFDLPVGRLSRTPFGEYPQYHTSADDLDFIKPGQLFHALQTILEIVQILEEDAPYANLSPKGEPQLGKRGLYAPMGGMQSVGVDQTALLWVLNQSDGSRGLLDIAERAGMPFAAIARAKDFLVRKDLLAPADVLS